MNKFEILIQECDADIRGGQPQKVAARLAGINLTKVPEEWRLQLAKICRRSGHYSQGIRLLTGPVLQQKGESAATPHELAEYSVLLLRSGAAGEAMDRLQMIDPKLAPESLLYKAFAHFSIWEYAAAVPMLEQYLRTPMSDYARLVASTNLAFAFVETRNYIRALTLLTEILQATKSQGHRQLQSACHMLFAQVHIQQREFSHAHRELNAARELSDQAQTNDNFQTTKWGLILEGLETGSTAPFDKLSQVAITNRSWESWREADFYSLGVKMNRERFVHLYFGTPFPEFRSMIEREFGDKPVQPIYVFGPKAARRLDLRTGQIDGGDALEFGGKLHQVLELLLRDFYQPLRIAGIFSELFRGEKFNINSSPGRVHQLIWRAREWLKTENIPVTLDETEGFYSLKLTGDFSFRVPLQKQVLESGNLRFEKLKEFFGESRAFLAREAQLKLGVSKATMHELLKWGMEQGKIQRNGASARLTTYVILPAEPLRKVS